MGIKNGIRAFLFLLLLLCGLFPARVLAGEVPKLDQIGSIFVIVRDGETPISGGTLTLYRVGDVKERSGTYFFQLTGEFSGSGVSLTERSLQSADTAAALADWAVQEELAGMETLEVVAEGITFSELSVGLYLIVQYEPAPEYEFALPFLVTIPMKVTKDGTETLDYDVDATPKLDPPTLKSQTVSGSTPGGSGTPDASDTPDTSDTADASDGADSGTLPQTGQLNWPVPVLTALGLFLILLGVWLRSGGSGAQHEK